jgi:hypothetical protein
VGGRREGSGNALLEAVADMGKLIPTSQACIVCRDTPTAAAVSVTVRPSLITANTA